MSEKCDTCRGHGKELMFEYVPCSAKGCVNGIYTPKKKIQRKCNKCGGEGHILNKKKQKKVCWKCQGNKTVEITINLGDSRTCKKCRGESVVRKKVGKKVCSKCNGSGKKPFNSLGLNWPELKK